VTSAPAKVDCEPYAVVVPYDTCELEAWSVVQVIVAEAGVIPVAVTAVITGAGVEVVNVKFADDAIVPESFVDRTW
jgi:hypothetical protein